MGLSLRLNGFIHMFVSLVESVPNGVIPLVGLGVHLDGFFNPPLGQQEPLCHPPLLAQLSQLGLDHAVTCQLLLRC